MKNVMEKCFWAYNYASRNQTGTDLIGIPIFEHCKRVAELTWSKTRNINCVTIALLHDILEDQSKEALPSVEFAIERGTSLKILKQVQLLTKPQWTPYQDHIKKIGESKIATAIKICDIEDNLDPVRLMQLKEDGRKQIRIEKYQTALLYLKQQTFRQCK
jgi:(p)ppGpp synthase/HD superfamily hydrolase